MTENYIDLLVRRVPALEPLAGQLREAVQTLLKTYESGGKILTCGNGGSAADAEHIVGELMKGFLLKRHLTAGQKKGLAAAGCPPLVLDGLQRPIPAVSLVSGVSLPTAFANDVDGSLAFAQQVLGLAKPGDTLIAISTSGNSPNVIYAAQTAKALGVKIIGLTGARPCKLKGLADICLMAPSSSTPIIQEYHIAIYHCLCAELERLAFGEDENLN